MTTSRTWILDADRAAANASRLVRLSSAGSGPRLEPRLNPVTMSAALAELLTTQGDTVRRGGSVPERLALGTSGYVLASDGTDLAYRADRLEWVEAISGAGVTDFSSSVDMEAGYVYLVVLTDILPANDGVTLYLRLGTSGGIDSGTSDYDWTRRGMHATDQSFGAADTADSEIELGLSAGNGATEAGAGIIRISHPANRHCRVESVVWYDHDNEAANKCQRYESIGTRATTTLRTRFRILYSAGNIAAISGNVYRFRP